MILRVIGHIHYFVYIHPIETQLEEMMNDSRKVIVVKHTVALGKGTEEGRNDFVRISSLSQNS